MTLSFCLWFGVWLSLSLSSLLGFAVATAPDLLRLVAVPVFAWVALRDVKTRRVSSGVWIPLSGLGAVVLVWDGLVARNEGGVVWTQEFLLPVAISLGFVVPIAYLFWWVGGFGGADAKALLVLALLFPVFPAYTVGSWTVPLESTPIGAFSFTVLTNAVVVGIIAPVVLAIRNGLAGRIAPVMFVGWPIDWDRTPTTHGRLLQTPDGVTLSFSGRGLDLDALRMYLRWRGLSLRDVRDEPDRYRDPATLPDDPNPPTDGAVGAAGPVADGGESLEGGGSHDDSLEDEPLAASSADETGADQESVEGNRDARDDDIGDETLDHGREDCVQHEGGSTSEDGQSTAAPEFDDPWGADAFLEDIDGSAYGTSPRDLREGLEVLCTAESVWISPGTPFLVPVFAGLVIALVYGDLLMGVLV